MPTLFKSSDLDLLKYCTYAVNCNRNSFRAGENKKQNKFVTQKMLRQVCFLLCQGCRDDFERGSKAFCQFTEDFNVLAKLKALLKSQHEDFRVADVIELIEFTIEEVKQGREKVLGKIEKDQDATMTTIDRASKEKSPFDFDAQARKRRAQAAAQERKNKIMAQMSKLQDKFAKGHAGELEGIELDSTPTPGSSQPDGEEGFFHTASSGSGPIAVGQKRSLAQNEDASCVYTCILCQADQSLVAYPQQKGTPNADALVSPAHIKKTTVLCATPKSVRMATNNHREPDDDFLLLTADCAPAVAACGHIMHAKCYWAFMDDVLKKERRDLGQG